jgi:hypothetical protein
VSHYLGFLVECTVAGLLMVTIGYCFILNRRLRRFRADEQALRSIIAELITATEIADRAIGGLKVTVRECDQNLGERLRSAERFCAEMDRQIAAGGAVLAKVAQIAAAARPAPSPAASSARGMLAAAEALVERTRIRAGDIAA